MNIKKTILWFFALVAFFSSVRCNRSHAEFPVRSGDKGIQMQHIERTMRYRPDGESFIIENGGKMYNRSLYGNNTAFRVVGGDVPYFMLFGQGKDGMLHLGIKNGSESKWLEKADRVITRYTPGRLTYSVTDQLLGNGTLVIAVLASHHSEKMLIEVSTIGRIDAQLVMMFGSASGVRFSRNGDLNTDSPDKFLFKTEECKDSRIDLYDSRFVMHYPFRGREKRVEGVFPSSASLKVADASMKILPGRLWESQEAGAPVLAALCSLSDEKSSYFSFEILSEDQQSGANRSGLAYQFQEAESGRQKIAGRMTISTPDEYMNTLGATWAIATDGCWQEPTWLHGAIGWRTRLNGWRIGYAGDVLGWHDRARTHFTAYNKSQLPNDHATRIIPGEIENLAREAKNSESMLYSTGYISPDPDGRFRMLHYDMNLVYIDALLWHLLWTGDIQFAKQSWPIIEKHLAWEKRCFDPYDEGVYNAYCCIWASDALQYSGGNAAHSSAYNYRANLMAADLAQKLGHDPAPYRKEAEKIKLAMNSMLWLPNKGIYAEFKDRLGKRLLHESPAVWTIYHAIDSELPDDFQAYMMTRYIDNSIPRFPLKGNNVPEGFHTISTTNWHPYIWSINNVAFAEVAHTALAYWQANRPEEAFKLWKANILDFMYMGSVPGNIGQISYYDAARGEVYSDFSDPAGIGSRALVEGLFGIVPDALNGQLLIRPGIPSSWERANIKTTYIDYDYKREGNIENYTIRQSFPRNMKIKLVARAFADSVLTVTLNGKPIEYDIVEKVGYPALEINTPGNESLQKISIEWAGNPFADKKDIDIITSVPETELLLENQTILALHDPQGITRNARFEANRFNSEVVAQSGHYTLFLKVKQGNFTWWMPCHIEAKPALEIIPAEEQPIGAVSFYVRNNTPTTLYKDMVMEANGKSKKMSVRIPGKGQQEKFVLPASFCRPGTNRVKVTVGELSATGDCVNWNIQHKGSVKQVKINDYFNDSINNIYKNEYLSPRPKQITLQLPKHGYGNWCHFNDHPLIDDSGLRQKAGSKNLFELVNGLSFTTPIEGKNIVFVSQWDNYPNETTIPLKGKAAHAYLLMTGSTNHMQSRIENGRIFVTYTDGSEDVLQLINPNNWWSIEQDMHIDDFAFHIGVPSPVRVELKTGNTYLVGKGIGVEQWIEGGAASVLDIPLNPAKELKSLTLSATSNDVVIGLMGISLVK